MTTPTIDRRQTPALTAFVASTPTAWLALAAFVLVAMTWFAPPLYGQVPVVLEGARAKAQVKGAIVRSQTFLISVNGVRMAVEAVTLEGDPDEEEPHLSSVRISNNGFEELVLGRGATASQARPRLDSLLKRKIDDANRLYGLTDLQMQQLQLAGRGDLQRLYDRFESLLEQAQGTRTVEDPPPGDPVQWAVGLCREAVPLRSKFSSGPFDDGSLFAKTLKRLRATGPGRKYEVLREFDRMHSFDVNLRVVTRNFFRNTGRPGNSVRVKLPAGEEIMERKRYRQVYSAARDGMHRRRVEEFDLVKGGVARIVTFDGERRHSFDAGAQAGVIGAPPAAGYEYASAGHDYAQFLGKSYRGKPFSELLWKVRDNLKQEGELFVLEGPPAETTTIPMVGYRAWLDPAHDMRMTRFDRYEIIPKTFDGHDLTAAGGDGAEHVCESFVVEQFHRVEPGFWVPVRVRGTIYESRGPGRGEIDHELIILVDQEQSNWNVPIDKRAFSINFPPGTRVHDELTGVDDIVGDQTESQ